MIFLVVSGLMVLAAYPPFLEDGDGVGPTSTNTVSKTIVVEYNLGNYNSPDGTKNLDGEGSYYEKQYTLYIPEDAQAPVGTTLQISNDGSGSCKGNFSAFICSQSADSMTVVVTQINSTSAWEDNLILQAVNYK
jgi:hypothetical protein